MGFHAENYMTRDLLEKYDEGFVIVDSNTNEYYCGLRQWNKQLRQAKIYHAMRYVDDVKNEYKNKNLTVYKVRVQLCTS